MNLVKKKMIKRNASKEQFAALENIKSIYDEIERKRKINGGISWKS